MLEKWCSEMIVALWSVFWGLLMIGGLLCAYDGRF
jgi:hypothetical protein